MKLRLAFCTAALLGYVGTVAADTTDSKWQSQVVLEKQASTASTIRNASTAITRTSPRSRAPNPAI